MGLMLSVLVMCVGVLEAISSAQQIRESFIPLDTIRSKRRMVADHGTGNIRHADISWPGDIPRGSHVIKKRSGLTSPHSSFDVPEDGHVSRRCSEHFDSAQLERAVSAILLEEDNSSDETSEEVTQILSGVVQSRIEFPTLQPGFPKKLDPLPETSSHDTFAPINEPRHDAERVPGKQPLLASEAVEADIVDLKPTERLIKYPSAETVLDDDSSESSEKYSREKRSVSRSETSVSYGSELPSSSVSSEILADEGCKSRPFALLSVTGNEMTGIPEKDEIAVVGNEPYKTETISEFRDSTNNVQVAENTVNMCPQRQLPMPKTTKQEDQNTNEIHQSLSENQVLTLQNDDEPKSNESEPFPQREAIVELIESTNSVVFSEDARPMLRHSDSIVELIQSTNSLVFVPESVSQSQENEEVRVPVDRQESIEKLIKSTNKVVFQKVVADEDLISPNKENNGDDEIKCVRSSKYEDSVLNEFSDTSLTDQVDIQAEKRNATSRAVVLAEGENGRTSFIHESRDETLEVSAEISNDEKDTMTALCENNGSNFIFIEDDLIKNSVKTVSDILSGIELPDVKTPADALRTGEPIPSQCDLTDRFIDSDLVVQKADTTSGIGQTKLVKIADDTLPLNVLDTPTSEYSGTLVSSDGIDHEEIRSVARPIQTSSSSEEEDSANSVTTIITECVQTIVDIGPPLENREDVGEILSKVVSKPPQDHGDTQANQKEIEDIDCVVSVIQDEDTINRTDTIGESDERKNSGLVLKTENLTSDRNFSEQACVDEQSSENEVNNAASSPESKVEPTVVIPKLPSTNVDEIITERTLQLKKQPLVQNDDFEIDSVDPTFSLSNELVQRVQQDYVITEHESESTLGKQADGSTFTATTHLELGKENIESLNNDVSRTESIAIEKVEKEIVGDALSIEENPISSHDVITVQDAVSTLSDFGTNVSDELNPAVLNSENIVVAACNVANDAHKLAESATKRADGESAIVSDNGASDHPASEILRQSKIVTEEVQTLDSLASSQVDSQIISKTVTPELLESKELEIDSTEDSAHNQVERATKTESKESLSFVDRDRTTLTSPESEGVVESGAVSEEVQSSTIDLQSSKTQNHQVRGEQASDSTRDIPPESAGRATETGSKASVAVGNGSCETNDAEEILVVSEQIESSDYDALKIDSETSKIFSEQLVDKPTKGSLETENTVSVAVDPDKSALTSRVTENAGEIPVVNKEIQSRDGGAEGSAGNDNTASVVVDSGILAISSRVINTEETQASGKTQSVDGGGLNTVSEISKTSSQQLVDKPAQRATKTEDIASVPVDEHGLESEVAGKSQIGIEKTLSKNAGISKMDSRITKRIDSPKLNTDLQEDNEAKKLSTGDGRPTNETATDSNTSASEVQQEIRRVSSIDEGEVINVKASQDRTADMENVQDDPSSSPNKAFWVRE